MRACGAAAMRRTIRFFSSEARVSPARKSERAARKAWRITGACALLLRRKIDFARGQGEAVRFADGVSQNQREREFQIADLALDDGTLLVILPSKDRGGWLSDLKELQDHGADAAKMTGSRSTAKGEADAVLIHPGGEIRRIDLLGRRMENGVGSSLPTERLVGRESSGIAGEIFLGTKLGGIHEDRNDDRAARTGGPASAADQGRVPAVQRSHGRNENNGCRRAIAEAAGRRESAEDLQEGGSSWKKSTRVKCGSERRPRLSAPSGPRRVTDRETQASNRPRRG